MTWKKKYNTVRTVAIVFALMTCMQALGQKAEVKKKIEAAKIALITERLELSPEQAEKFWPIYRSFEEERKAIRKAYNRERKSFDPNTATEEENLNMLNMAKEVKQKQLNLENDYTDRILKVITTRQLNNLRQAEGDFKEMLLKRIRAEQTRRQNQQRNSERLKNRKN